MKIFLVFFLSIIGNISAESQEKLIGSSKVNSSESLQQKDNYQTNIAKEKDKKSSNSKDETISSLLNFTKNDTNQNFQGVLPSQESMSKVLAKMIIVLLLFGIGCYGLIRLIKSNKIWTISKNSNQALKILETKMLGNKQFLLVVEYGDQKMLLGVTPTKIEHLCFLDSNFKVSENSTEQINTNLNENISEIIKENISFEKFKN